MGKEIDNLTLGNSPISVVDEESGLFYGHAQIHSCARDIENNELRCLDNVPKNYSDGQDILIGNDGNTCDENEKKAALNKMPSVDDDFLQTLLFPHMETTLKDDIMGANKRSSTYALIKPYTRYITTFFAELLYPSQTKNNMKIFGGKKAVELERERAKHSCYIIHPCSKFR